MEFLRSDLSFLEEDESIMQEVSILAGELGGTLTHEAEMEAISCSGNPWPETGCKNQTMELGVKGSYKGKLG